MALAEGRRPLGAVSYSSYEPGELSKWLSHCDSTINIITLISIAIISTVLLLLYNDRKHCRNVVDVFLGVSEVPGFHCGA